MCLVSPASERTKPRRSGSNQSRISMCSSVRVYCVQRVLCPTAPGLPTRGLAAAWKACMAWGEGCSLVTPLTLPHWALQSRLCVHHRSITSTPHAPVMGAIIQHHPIAQRRRARPREGGKWLQPQGCLAEKLEGQPSQAPASPARDSLSRERALPCLPSHALAPELDDGPFLTLRVLLADLEGESSWRDRL